MTDSDRIMDCVGCGGPVRYLDANTAHERKANARNGFAKCAACGRWHRIAPDERWDRNLPETRIS
jgi:hypothetical protein